MSAVRLARIRAEALKQAARLAARQPVVLPGERLARASATLRINGVEYRGTDRNLLDAIGNAQVAA